jgi:hypothetical protein
VRRGKKGRFRDGYHPGGACYGYVNEPIEDTSRRGVHGRFEVIGCKQRINEEQAAIVRRIFREYIEGRSSTQIARALNKDEVPPPQGARSRCEASWSKEAVYSILTNERYIGNVYWNRTYQVIDPDTGKMKSRLRSEKEVMYRHDEDLRIISDEVFEAAKEQRKRLYRDNHVQFLGGMSRTAAARQYLAQWSAEVRCLWKQHACAGWPSCLLRLQDVSAKGDMFEFGHDPTRCARAGTQRQPLGDLQRSDLPPVYRGRGH